MKHPRKDFHSAVLLTHTVYMYDARVLPCFDRVAAGGFAKAPGKPPDLLHSFYSLSWLSLSKEEGLEAMDAALGITRRAGARVTSGIDVRATR